ncbi:unnamed protein product [Onchocerca ochengi]|uniref:Uncharacterized protein n=1 Tax=Onchocerca ochengi TaxID=42157 RepID=A0A182ETB1_ONCOC|nr:unnamed protein product [Onchocerca ochengi]
MDANRPLIMRNAIHARRSLRRSKTRIRGSFRRKLATAFTMQSISTTGYNLATSPTEMSNPEEPIPKIEPNKMLMNGYYAMRLNQYHKMRYVQCSGKLDNI